MKLKQAISTLHYVINNQESVRINKVKEPIHILLQHIHTMKKDNKRLQAKIKRQRKVIEKLEGERK